MVSNFAERLKECRENRNLKQTQVADILGTTRATISGYENKVSQPSLETLSKLAILYQVSTDYLLGIDKRSIIVLDNLTDKQGKIIENVVNVLKAGLIDL